MKEYTADPVDGPVHELAEGPRWDDLRESLSWVDIAGGQVFQATFGADGVSVTGRLDFPATAGAAVPASDGGLLVAAHDRIVAVSPDGVRRATPPLVDRAALLRLNDAAVDPGGRLLVGSLATDRRPGAASLLRLDPSGAVTSLRSGMNLANGIGWSPDGSTLYVVDSVPGTIWSVPYDVEHGELGTWTALVTEFDGLPDGLCVDDQGRIWVAVWNAAQVCCFAPTGEPIAVVRLPVPHVTATCFVGAARDRLLVTSARDELDDDARRQYPLSGRLFVADVDAVGLPTSHWTGSTRIPRWAQDSG